MENPVAIIIGAGKGIGRSVAQELASRGYRLALVARTASDLAATAKLIDRESLTIAADVAKVGEAERIVEQTIGKLARIDALINSAGYAPLLTMEALTDQEWRKIVDTNLSSVVSMSRAVWAAFRKQKGGAIVNISSLASRDPFAGLGAYGAAKAGLNLLGLAMAREGAEHNIRVHTLALGAVETGMLRAIKNQIEVPREMTLSPQDVARVVGECVMGSLQYTSGEVITLHKTV